MNQEPTSIKTAENKDRTTIPQPSTDGKAGLRQNQIGVDIINAAATGTVSVSGMSHISWSLNQNPFVRKVTVIKTAKQAT